MRSLSTLLCILVVLTAASPLMAQQGAGRPRQWVNTAGNGTPSNNDQTGLTISVHENESVIAWSEQGGVSAGLKDIYVAVSTDDGLSYGAGVRVDVGDGPHATDSTAPKVKHTASGAVFVAWEENRATRANGGGTLNNDVYFNVSLDGGRTFPNPARPMGLNPGQVSTDVDWIHVAVVGETAHVVWTDQVLCNQCYRQLWYARYNVATDTLTPARIINTQVRRPNPPTPRDAFNSVTTPKVAVSGTSVVVAFADDRNDSSPQLLRDVYVVMSPDGGNNWVEMPIESQPAGDVTDIQIARDGPIVAVCYRDFEVDAGGGIRCVVSQDGGFSWAPEANCAPALEMLPGTGSRYPHVAVNGVDVHVVWTDDRRLPSAGNSANRKAYHAYTHDAGTTWTVDQAVDALSGQANQFTRVEACDDVVMMHLERDVFGQNRTCYAWSMDRGVSWQVVAVGSGPDVDSPPEHEGEFFALNKRTLVGMSAFYDRPLGRNETYTSGLRVPYMILNGGNNIEGNASLTPGTVANLALRSVPVSMAGNTIAYFAVSTAGRSPATLLAPSMLLHVVPEPLTFDLLTGPFAALTTAGVLANGTADAMAFPWPFPVGTPEFTVAAVLLDTNGTVRAVTDPMRIVTL